MPAGPPPTMQHCVAIMSAIPAPPKRCFDLFLDALARHRALRKLPLTSIGSNRAMVVKHRWRVFVGLCLLWSVSALVTGYFVAQAYEGARGIEAKRQIKARAFALRTELTDL